MVDKFKTSDDFEFDDSLDFNFDGISADFGEIKDDRKPITKLKDSVVASTKDYVQDKGNIVNFMRTAMPEAYGEAFDMIREGNTEVQNLYNSVKSTVKPMVESTKGMVRTALPAAKGILPASLHKKIEDATKPSEESSYQGYSSQDSDDARLETLLADVFSANQELESQKEERDNYRSQLAEGVEQVRHNDVLSLINQIQKGVDAQTKYQDKITYNFQKKSLELQYRHFWATAEILKDQKESNKSILELLTAVQKNTALPDYAKLQNKEAFFEQSRNKFVTDVRDSLFGGASNYVRQFGENVRKQANGMLSNFKMGFDAMEGMGGQVVSQIANADQMGSSVEEELGAFATPLLLDELSTKAGNKTRKWLSKQKKVDRIGQNISRATSEMPERIEDLLTNSKYDAGMFEKLRMTAASLLPNTKADTQLEFTAMKDLNKPTSITGQDTKTLREIIPGLLSRIHREIRILRTGDTDTPLLGYDFEQNRFSNDKAIAKNLRNRFGNAEHTQAEIGKLIDRVDAKGAMNEEQRKELTQELIGKVYGQKSLTFEKLAHASAWSGDNAQEFAELFKRYGKIDSEGKMGMNRKTAQRQSHFMKNLRNTVSANGDPRIFIQEMINMGQYDMLLRSGMVDATGNINLKNVKKHLGGDEVKGTKDHDDIYTTAVGNATTPLAQTIAVQEPAMKYSPKDLHPGVEETPAAQKLDFSALEKMLQGSIADLGKTMSQNQPTNEPFVDSILHASFDKANDTLLRIEDILLNANSVAVQHYYHVAGGEEGEKTYSSLFDHIKDKTTEAAGTLYQGASDTVKGVSKKASRMVRKMRPKAMRIGRYAMGKARQIKNKTLDVFNSDVFVGLEEKPRIILSILKNGGYYDKATNKVIKSLKDIKGDVVDATGKVILQAEEIREAYVGGEWARKLTDIIGSAWTKIKDAADIVKDIIPTTLRKGLNAGRKALNFAKNALPPYDVYVEGDNKPTLYASFFKLGKYRSKKTGKTIIHPRQIDGEVLDEDDNIVLSEDQIKKGLVDVRGGKVGNLASRILARVANPVMNALKIVKDVGADAFRWITGKIKDGASFIKNIISGKIDIGVYAKRTGDILEEIRDFMFTTWGKNKKKVIGDSDGDGVRDNSLADMAKKKKSDAREGEEEKDMGGKKGYNLLDKITGAIAGMKTMFSKKKKEEEEDDDDDGFGLSDAADLADIADTADNAREKRKERKRRKDRDGPKDRKGRKTKNTKPPQAKKPAVKKPGKLARLGRGVGQAATKAAGLVRPAAGAVADVAGSSIVQKGLFNTALPKALATVGLGAASTGVAAASAGLGVAGGVGTVLGGVGSVLGFLASWPVAIAGTAAYLGYKAYKNAQKTKLTPLSIVRLAQYGYTVEDKASWMRVFELENLLNEHVTYDSNGWASVDRNKVDPKAIVSLFGLTSQATAARFLKWYDARFYPVYTRALSGMKQLKVDNPLLSKVESQLEPSVKEKYMDTLVEGCVDYHDKLQGPPPDAKLKVDNKQVYVIANEQRIALRKAEKNETGQTKATQAAELASPLIKQSISDNAQKAAENPNDYTIKDKEGNVLKDLSHDQIKKALQGGATISVRVEVPAQVLQTDPNRLDALTCIRYKTYGLSSMMLDKVQQLMALEALCSKYLLNNSKGVTFSAGAEEILVQATSFFGKHNVAGQASTEWKFWFNERFLPVYLPFASAVFKLTGKKKLIEGIGLLTPSQQLKLANMMTGQATLEGNRVAVSVWEVANSPWVDYHLNTNPDSVMGNVETIRVLVSKIELKEPLTAKEPSKDGKSTSAKVEEDLSKPAFVFRTPKKSKNTQLNAGANSARAQGVQAAGDIVLGTGQKLSRIGEAAKLTAGSGKKWADLPNPSGSGWASMKDLIIEAAKAVGVEPESLAAYIAVESGFDPNARPPGGNAMGLGQFMPGTWADMMKNYSAALGVPAGTRRDDARASALFTAMYLKENLKTIGNKVKRPVSTAEGYLGHFAGPTGASDLLSAKPDDIAAQIRPAAAKSNPNVFYDPKSKQPYTVKEMIAKLQEKLSKRPGEFGVKTSDFGGAATSPVVAEKAPSAGGAAVAQAQPTGVQTTALQIVDKAQGTGGRITQAGFGNIQTASAVNTRERPEMTLKPSVQIDTSVKASTKATGMPIKAGQSLELILQREPSTDDGTFGVLRLPDGSSFLSLELPWRNNKMASSCIPPGSYKTSKRQTSRHGYAYEVKNVPGRSGILIHAGTTAGDPSLGKKADSQGCILLGLGRNTRKSGQKGITESKAAMTAFYEKMQDMPFTLTVINGAGEEASVEKNPETAAAVEKISSAAPQSTAAISTTSAPISTGPTNARMATPVSAASTPEAAPASPQSGLRAALSSIKGNQINPVNGSAEKASTGSGASSGASMQQMLQMSRGFKPTAQEMQARDSSLVDTLTKNTSETNVILQKNLEANLSTASNMEKLVKMLEKVNPAAKAPETAAPAPQEQKATPKLTAARTAYTPPEGVSMKRNY